MTPKQEYIKHCKHSRNIGLFFQPFWWDELCDEWDVIKANIDHYVAFLLYPIEKKKSLQFIRNPFLTPYTGVIYLQPDYNELIKQQLTLQLINNLPKADVIHIDFQPNTTLDSVLTSTTLKHTNLLYLTNKDDLYSALKPALKRQIKKATRNLIIYENPSIDRFYQLYQKTFDKLNVETAFPLAAFKKCWKVCQEHECGKLIFIKDEFENDHAAIFLVYDNKQAYYLAGGTDAHYYGSGAMSYLMWYAIEASIEMGKQIFDFEGSMIPNVDRFFKNFSPQELYYYNYQKINSVLYSIYKRIKK